MKLLEIKAIANYKVVCASCYNKAIRDKELSQRECLAKSFVPVGAPFCNVEGYVSSSGLEACSSILCLKCAEELMPDEPLVKLYNLYHR